MKKVPELQVQIVCNKPFYTLDDQFIRGKVIFKLQNGDMPQLGHLLICLEGRETFLFQQLKTPSVNQIQNQARFFQSEQIILSQFAQGLPQGRHTFQFQIPILDDQKRPPTFNLHEETDGGSGDVLGSGYLTLQCQYQLKIRGFARDANHPNATILRHEQTVVFVRPDQHSFGQVRGPFAEIAKAEVLTASSQPTTLCKAQSLVSAGISLFMVEAESDIYRIDEKIPIRLVVDNKFCQEKVQSIKIKLVRCVKFRIDFGSGQECISKSTLLDINPLQVNTNNLGGPLNKAMTRTIGQHQKQTLDVVLDLTRGVSSQSEQLQDLVKNLGVALREDIISCIQVVPTCSSQNFIVFYVIEVIMVHNRHSQPIKLEFEIHLENQTSIADCLTALHVQDMQL